MFAKIKSFLFENRTAKQTVAKNTVWLSISNFGGRFIKAIIIIYGARILGTSEWGLFSYAMTLAGFFTLTIDPGLNAMIMREIPKADEEQRAKILATTSIMKAALIIIAALAVLFIAPLFSTLPGAKALLPIVALVIAFDTARDFFSAYVRAREKAEWEAGIFLFTNIAIVAFGFLFLAYNATAGAFALSYATGAALGALAAFVVLLRSIKGRFGAFSARLSVSIFRSAWPFAITGALGLLLTNTDVLIVSWLRNASDVGIYSAVIRIIQLLYFIPVILQYTTLPTLSRTANTDNDRFRMTLERTVSLTFLISIPLAFGGLILGTQVMSAIFGPDFAAGGAALKILMISMIVDYPATIMSAAIFAYDHQRSLIISSAIGGIANIVFDILLIPAYGITGSAVATLLAQAMSNIYLWRTMDKINHFSIVPRLKKIAGSALIMLLVTLMLYLLRVNVFINVVLSAAIYFGMLRLLKDPLFSEVLSVIASPKEARS